MNRREALRILGLPEGAGLDQVKSAFRKLAKSFHPDLNRTPGANDRFTAIAEAYSVLESWGRTNRTNRTTTGRASSSRARKTTKSSAPKPSSARHEEARAASVEQVYSLGQILVSSSLPDLRVFAAQNLGSTGRKMAYAFLKHGMYDRDRRVVLASIRSVGHLGVHQAAADLAKRYESGDGDIQVAVLEAVERIGLTGSFRAVLRRAAASPHQSVRETAARMA